MSDVSSRELYHFTKFKYLKSILLQKSFYPRFNLEQTDLNFSLDKNIVRFAVPMVCFCDIPLKLTFEHRKIYGKCGIALSENWRDKKKLNPVFYINKNSNIADTISKMADSFDRLLPSMESVNSISYEMHMLRNNYLTLMHSIKPYEKSTRKFYDEREWRYIPDHTKENQNDLNLSYWDFKIPSELAKANKRVEKYQLDFEISDINYLIVSSNKEKEILEGVIQENFGGKVEIKII
ncbi:abortive infection system antitoxin AbiGi family protein [Wenyingzhuangia sp. IMCC45467]